MTFHTLNIYNAMDGIDAGFHPIKKGDEVFVIGVKGHSSCELHEFLEAFKKRFEVITILPEGVNWNYINGMAKDHILQPALLRYLGK